MVSETTIHRCSRLAISLAVGAWLLVATPAFALSVDVFFDGAMMAGDPNTNFGISESSAIDARDNFGIQILEGFDFIGSISGVLSPDQTLQSFNPNPPTSTSNRAMTSWTMENVFGSDIIGASYVMFTHTDPFFVNGVLIDYADANVGITIDAALGWVIIKTSQAGVDYYYPSILVDRAAQNPQSGVIAAGSTSAPFNVDYVVKEPLTLVMFDGAQDEYPFPEIEIGFANIVPEPSTALLLGLGLLGLAVGGRKR